MTTNWKTEFSDFDAMPEIPENWTDISWHNDSCPSFECGKLRIYVDYANPESREVATPFRFGVTADDNDGNGVSLLDSDDWTEVLTFVAHATDKLAPMTRVDAVRLANHELDAACDDFSFGKPSQEDVLRYAETVATQIHLKHRVLLSVHQDEETGVTFS